MFRNFLFHFGKYLKLLGRGFSWPERPRMYYKELVRQMVDIGVGSLIIVSLIAIFIGAVTAIQFAYQLESSFIPKYYIGYIVRDITIIELAPTFTGLVLAGKVGSNMAAELGSMRQKEQIDAMEIMGVNTAAYLVMPKIIAAMLVIPMLTVLSAFVGISGGYLATVPFDMLSSDEYIRGTRVFFVPNNVTMMLVKAVLYAFILTSISCFKGFYVDGGNIELGRASTQAVVLSDIFILIADLVVAVLLT